MVKSDWRRERRQPGPPGLVQVGSRREPAVDLQAHHAVRERPHGAGAGLVVAGRLGERLRGPGLEPVGELFAAQGLVVHEGLQGGLVREVLVQRGRLDAEHAGDPSHGKSLGALGVEQGAGGPGDLRLTLVQRPGGGRERVRHG